MKNYEEELKKEIFKITRQTLEIDKYNNIYRYQRKNISDEMEESFSKYIANNLNNKKLHYKIAASLTIEFTDEFVIKKIKKDNIINLSKNNKTTFKPDLIIYKKDELENNKNFILALVEFKNDLGYAREIFGKKIDEKINVDEQSYEKYQLYKDKQYKEIYENYYHSKNKIDIKNFYGYRRKYIMELLNNKETYNITSKIRIDNKEIETYEIITPCKTYILSCSCNNAPINHIKALYKYDFCKNNEDKYVKFNTFFNESIRLDEDINKDKKTYEEITLTLDDDEKIGYKNFIDELTKDIKNKI